MKLKGRGCLLGCWQHALSYAPTGNLSANPNRGSRMDITEITETDPRKVFLEIDKIIRPTNPNFSVESDRSAILSYFAKLKHAAESLGIGFDLAAPDGNNSSEFLRFFDEIKAEMDKQKIDILLEDVNRKKWRGIRQRMAR
jgi:hypothetical protein